MSRCLLENASVIKNAVLAGSSLLAGGNGSLGSTYLGELIGAAVSIPAGLLMMTFNEDSDFLAVSGVTTYLIGPLVGGIIGYENSQTMPPQQ